MFSILWLVLALLWVVLIISDVRWQVVRWLLLHALCVLLSLVGMFQNLMHFLKDKAPEKPAAPAAPVPEEKSPEAIPAELTEEAPAELTEVPEKSEE